MKRLLMVNDNIVFMLLMKDRKWIQYSVSGQHSPAHSLHFPLHRI